MLKRHKFCQRVNTRLCIKVLHTSLHYKGTKWAHVLPGPSELETNFVFFIHLIFFRVSDCVWSFQSIKKKKVNNFSITFVAFVLFALFFK